jgi:hypothetical protein
MPFLSYIVNIKGFSPVKIVYLNLQTMWTQECAQSFPTFFKQHNVCFFLIDSFVSLMLWENEKKKNDVEFDFFCLCSILVSYLVSTMYVHNLNVCEYYECMVFFILASN